MLDNLRLLANIRKAQEEEQRFIEQYALELGIEISELTEKQIYQARKDCINYWANHNEISFLRRTIGNRMWLDNLTDDEFTMVANEIVSIFNIVNKNRRGLTIIYTETVCPSCGYGWLD